MTGIRVNSDGVITAKMWGHPDEDMILVPDFYEGQVGELACNFDEYGCRKELPVEQTASSLQPDIEEHNDLQRFLASTDWYVIRKMERGVEIPKEIRIQRLQAIERLDVLKPKIEEAYYGRRDSL